MFTDIDIGSTEDGYCVEYDSVDATPLLKEHGCKHKQKGMPDCFVFQL
jgi:hypothetical protein